MEFGRRGHRSAPGCACRTTFYPTLSGAVSRVASSHRSHFCCARVPQRAAPRGRPASAGCVAGCDAGITALRFGGG